MESAALFGYFIGVIIWGIIWGFISKHVNESKGYDGGFAWGFWLGFIGLIVVACKPDNRSSYYSSQSSYGSGPAPSLFDNNPSVDTWRCYKCTKRNPSYQTTCSCGLSKTESDRLYRDGDTAKKSVALPAPKPANEADEIARFKKMLDDGMITEEEFQAKKKQILGI